MTMQCRKMNVRQLGEVHPIGKVGEVRQVHQLRQLGEVSFLNDRAIEKGKFAKRSTA